MNNEGIKLYSEFKFPATARILGTVLGLLGIGLTASSPGMAIIGIPLIAALLGSWGLFISGTFYPETKVIFTNLTFFGFPVKKKYEEIEPDHITFSRSILTSKIQVGPRVAGVTIDSSDYQYNVFMIYNKNKKELVHSINDYKEAKEIAYSLATQMNLKIFSAIDHPKKWINPVTGEETVAVIKRKR